MAADAARNWLRDRLGEGARGEIGLASQIAREALDDPRLVPEIVALLDDSDPAVVAHAAHVTMQVAIDRPDLFGDHIEDLLDLLDRAPQWEIGEQAPKILATQPLSPEQAKRLHSILLRQIAGRSAIAAASALTAIVDLALRGLTAPDDARNAHAAALGSSSKALAARARRLQPKIQKLG